MISTKYATFTIVLVSIGKDLQYVENVLCKHHKYLQMEWDPCQPYKGHEKKISSYIDSG